MPHRILGRGKRANKGLRMKSEENSSPALSLALGPRLNTDFIFGYLYYVIYTSGLAAPKGRFPRRRPMHQHDEVQAMVRRAINLHCSSRQPESRSFSILMQKSPRGRAIALGLWNTYGADVFVLFHSVEECRVLLRCPRSNR